MTTVTLIIFALVLLNGIFVAAEFALVGVNRTAVDALAAGGNARAVALRETLQNPRAQDRYIATAQLGVTFASLGLGMYGEEMVAGAIESWLLGDSLVGQVTAHAIGFWVAVGLMTYVHVVFGEMIAKSVALGNPLRVAFFTGPITRGLGFLLRPMVVGLEWMSNTLLRLMGVDRSESGEGQMHTAEDLAHIVEHSTEGGELGGEAGRALSEMFDFHSLKADDVMVPRVAIHALQLGAGPEQIQEILREAQHTRYPVHDGDIDAIIGMVHIRDLLLLLRRWLPLQRELVRPISFVPETMELNRVLAVMRRDHTHAVIVMDEQGGTAGMLTIKNLFEEVVGTIEEGAVEVEGRQEAYRDAMGRLHALGTLRVDELEEIVDVEVPEIDAETISGLVLLKLGRPAQVGDTVRHGAVRLVVVEVEGRGVKDCLVERKA